MKSNIGTITSKKPGSLGLSQIHNFSNYNPAMKSRTQYGTPHTLSPPPEANTRLNYNNNNNNSTRPGMDSRRSVNENDRTFEASFENYPQSGNNIKTQEEKRDFVSMDELIGYLNFINNQPGDAFKEDTVPLEEISQQMKNKSKKNNGFYKQPDFGRKTPGQAYGGTERSPSLNIQSSMKTLNEGEEEGSEDGSSITDNKKKLNKNRAIKRIIETAFDLLEKNYHFTDTEISSLDSERSTSTQFNIYLKQYNRIIEQINSKELEEQMKFNKLEDENEDELQEVFEYTVMDDFREKISVMFTKEKVSKNNVNIMISAFRDSLVMLKANEMKVEFLNSDEPVKSFKMSEIENVEYFTHPYIFIVLTINKDKNKSKEHLYLKFTSEENQNKWDRALYCCFMSRKMNKKEKLFEIEFPVEDVMKKEKEEFTKEDEEYIFENNDDFHIVDKCFKEIPDTHSLTSNYPTYDMDGERNLMSDRSEYMNPAKNRNMTEEKITISIHNPDAVEDTRRLNTVQNKSSKYDNPFRGTELNTNNKPKEELSRNSNEPLGDSAMSFGNNNLKKTNSNIDDNYDPYHEPSFNTNSNINNQSSIKKEPSVFVQYEESQESMNYSKKSTFMRDQQQQPNNTEKSNKNLPVSSPQGSESPFNTNTNKSSNPFMRLLKVAESESEKERVQKSPSLSQEEILRKDTLLNERMQKIKRIREIEKNNVRGIVCQKERFFMNKEKIVFFHDENLITSSRKDESELMFLESVKNISSKEYQKNKYLEYWDYDYKKDVKEYKKIISVSNIVDFELVPSQLGQTTTTLSVGYNLTISGNPNDTNTKAERKELKLIFANPFSTPTTTTNNNTNINNNSPTMTMSKAQEVHEWIRLVKEV